MSMEIFLYEEIDRYTAEYFNQRLSWADANQNINVNINSQGGKVMYGISMLAKLNAFKKKGTGNINMIVDGVADSMAAFMLVFADYAEANDMATMTLHRAAYPEEYTPTPDEKKDLDRLNSQVREKMSTRMQNKGQKAQDLLSMLFDDEDRIDITLTAQEALEYGLIDKVVPLDVKITAKKTQAFALEMRTKTPTPEANNNLNNNKPIPKKKMDLAKLKNEHPEVYAQAVAVGEESGIKKGVEQEYERVNTILAYREADEDTCIKMIKDKEAVTASKIADLNIKMMKKQKLEMLDKEGEDGVETPPTDPPTPGEQEMSAQDKAEVEAYRKKKFTL